MKRVPLLLLGAAVLLANACADEERSPQPTMAAAKAPTHYVLTIQDSGSTATGTVVSNRGGIACTIQVTSSGTVRSGTCSARYKAGTGVFLTATPAMGALLGSWSGCTPASDNPLSCHLTVNANATVKVRFAPKPNQFFLTVAGGGGGNGKVVSTPTGINCTITGGVAGSTGCKSLFSTGVQVVLKATAASG